MVTKWVVWHLPELVAVGTPAVAAVAWSPWWAAAAVVGVAMWWRNEPAIDDEDDPDPLGVGRETARAAT